MKRFAERLPMILAALAMIGMMVGAAVFVEQMQSTRTAVAPAP